VEQRTIYEERIVELKEKLERKEYMFQTKEKKWN
jgi:hypothetical protein